MASPEPSSDAPPIELARRRAVWTIGDQVVSSAQSFAISLVVTHSVDLGGVGGFAIAFSTYQLLMAVTRPLNTDPLAVGFSASDRATQGPAAAAAAGAAVVLGVLAACICAAVGLVLGGTTGRVLQAFALCVPAFLVQDAWRCVLFTDGRPARAFVNDAIVLTLLAPACVVASRISAGSAAALVLAWGAATAAGALVGGFQAGVRPALGRALSWWRGTMHLGSRMLGENLVANAALSACLFAVAAGSGVSQLGRLRTAQVALGAASPVIIAMSTIVAAEGTRLLARAPRRFPRLVRVAAAGAAGLAGALALLWWWAPATLGRAVIGSDWAAARPLVLACGAYLAGTGVTLAVSGGLRVLRRPGPAFRARLVAAPVTVGAGVVGALYGPGPAMAGIAAGEWLCALLTAVAYRSVWKSWRASPWPVAPIPIVAVESRTPV